MSTLGSHAKKDDWHLMLLKYRFIIICNRSKVTIQRYKKNVERLNFICYI